MLKPKHYVRLRESEEGGFNNYYLTLPVFIGRFNEIITTFVFSFI